MTSKSGKRIQGDTVGRRWSRRRHGRRRRPDRRAVDDQYRHRRCRSHRAAGGGARPRRLRTGAHHRRPRRGGGRRAAHQGAAAQDGRHVPIVGDFHYIGHKLLADHPACAEALDEYASIPAMSASRTRGTGNSPPIVEMAIKHDKPVRIGANWGSLDQELLTRLMDDNSASASQRKPAR